jgi:TolA-binding protein
MEQIMAGKWHRWRGAALALALVPAGLAGPARAQEATLQELRMRQLEASVRALQAQVFASGHSGTPVAATAATPTAGPMTDMLTRIDAIEAQIARLTAQNEELGNRLRQIEAKAAAAPAPAPAPAAAATAAAAPEGTPAQLVPEKAADKPVTTGNLAAMGAAPAKAVVKPAPKPAAAPAPEKPSAARVAAVKAVVKPKTADAADDEYSYGFRLWEAKFYPEAQQQLKLYLDKYPKHAKASYGRNLLGRAYLDDGKPRDAAAWFLKNYQADAQGARAADSLLGLAQAMTQLNETSRACIALGEFATNYPGEAKGRLKTPFESTRAGVTCSN